MISLAPQPPSRSRFAADARRNLTKLKKLISDNRGIPDKEFFNSELWRAQKERFPPPHKCGYCEAPRTSVELHVEHYRPKSALCEWDVSDWKLSSDSPKDKLPVKPVIGHHGYWWLSYAWDNYLLACASCNSAFKGNLFPVDGARGMYEIDGEAGEIPLILNPYDSFKSSDHFEWDDLGFIHPAKHSVRGLATILACGLNSKEQVAARHHYLQQSIDPALRDLFAMGDTSALSCVKQLGLRAAPFAGMVRCVVTRALDGEEIWPD